MAEYLLPCSCGRKVPVSPSMAGETVECVCGARLDVPTLRHMRQLPEGVPERAARARTWTNRHRLAFAWIIVAGAAAATAGLLTWQMPPAPQLKANVDATKIIRESASPAEVYATFQELEKGIMPQTVSVTPEVRQLLEQRIQMNWGIRIALGIGLSAIAIAAIALLAGRARPRHTMSRSQPL